MQLTIVLTLILVLFGRIFFNSSDTELNYRQGTDHMHMHVSTCMTQTGAALSTEWAVDFLHLHIPHES